MFETIHLSGHQILSLSVAGGSIWLFSTRRMIIAGLVILARSTVQPSMNAIQAVLRGLLMIIFWYNFWPYDSVSLLWIFHDYAFTSNFMFHTTL